MQSEISTGHGGVLNSATLSSICLEQLDSEDYASVFSSIFSPIPPPSSLSPSSVPSNDASSSSFVDNSQLLSGYTDQRYYSQSDFLFDDKQDLINRHSLCLSYLREITKLAETLRQENINLRMANLTLNSRLTGSLLQQEPVDYNRDTISTSPIPGSTVHGNTRGIHLAEKACERRATRRVLSDRKGTANGVMQERVEKTNSVRFQLPKSISVRPNGSLSTVLAVKNSASRLAVPNPVKASNGTQTVYVHGGKEVEEPLGMEVYKQGMFKTELCNKWQETGSCPYGDHCQFAHGIDELRPILRHPRYKTQVCRMVLAGDPCPYGHRCHFRHTLTDEEKLIALDARALKAVFW